MTMVGQRDDGEVDPARAAVNDMLEAGLLDSVMEQAAAGELALTGEGGFQRCPATGVARSSRASCPRVSAAPAASTT
jgi:hypothetical protein